MKKNLLKNSLRTMVTGVLLMSAFGVYAQAPTCIVGGTNFDTDVVLCSPKGLTEDENPTTGWLPYRNLDVLLNRVCSDDNRNAPIQSAKHLPNGLQGNIMTTNDGKYPLDLAIMGQHNPDGNFLAGSSMIVANPRTAHSYLTDRPDNNMLVSVGSRALIPFFTYTVSGLNPGSQVTFTADLYSLWSPWGYTFYARKGLADFQIRDQQGGGIVNYNTPAISGTGANAVASIRGTSMNIRIGSSLNANREINNGTNSPNIAFDGSATLSFTGTADQAGVITFYVARGSNIPHQPPVGIDNVVIRGTIKPQIASQKVLPTCPANPVMLYPKQYYPPGTTFAWTSNTSPVQSGTSEYFSFVPPAQESYNVSLEVKMPAPECTAQTGTFALTTKKCCTTEINGEEIPLADTYIFYDDFGTFPSNSLYEWRKPDGTIGQLPVIGTFNNNGTSFVAQNPGDIDCPAVPYGYWAGRQHDTYCILFQSPYGGMLNDASGTKRGGMLFMGLNVGDYMDKVLYRREVCGLCKGKEITFGAKFAAANVHRTAVISVALELREGKATETGRLIYSTPPPYGLTGSEGVWKIAEHKFPIESDETCVTLQVVSKERDYGGNNRGDLVIDDIFFSVCTPPDVVANVSVAGGADPLNLCDNTDLTLRVETSSTVESYYPDVRYLFQYTYTNPKSAGVVWTDLGTIGTSLQQVIPDPPNHPIFSGLQNGDKVYFRVVVGSEAYLTNYRKDWETLDALSPCRAVSISAIPIETSLNCVKCTQSLPITISSTAPAPVTNDIKTVNLCEGQSVTLTSNIITPTPAYTNYIITWHKDSRTSPAIANHIADPGTTARPLTVNYADAAKYYVKVADKEMPLSSSCIKWDSILVIANPKPNAAITNNTGTTILTCTTSSISLTATGGATYSWSGSLGNNAAATVNAPGNYTVTVADAHGCTNTASISISENKTPPEAGITNNTEETVLTCTLLNVSLTATGGGTYSWDNGLGNNASVNVNSAGTYTVTVTAANGCTDTKSITITADKGDVVAGIINNTETDVLTCNTQSISLTATGNGTYEWSNGLGNGADVTVSAPGIYSVTVTAQNGCTDFKSITITENKTPPVVDITNNTETNVLTCALLNISLTATGGVSYRWDNNLGDNANAIASSAGTYTVTATGENGCENTASITITEDDSKPTVGINNNTGTEILTCNVQSISLTATGGVSYSWDSNLGGNANATISSPGTYTVTATAENGCTADKSITITEDRFAPTAGIINNSQTEILTCTEPEISLTATGGVSYLWSNGLGDKADATVKSAGIYSVTVTAENGCTDIARIEIQADGSMPVAGIINNSQTTVLTCADTEISLTATGGVKYSWSGGLGNEADANVTVDGTYTVTATAENGCSASTSIMITADKNPPIAGINSNTTILTCTETSILLTATGGVSYSWSHGLGDNASVAVSAVGIYTVTAKGSNGCTAQKSIDIKADASMPVANISTNTGTTVLTCAVPTIILTANSGNYTYLWNDNFGTNASIPVSAAGTYKVTVTSNENGCTATDNITITLNKLLPAISVTNPAICDGDNATITVSGAADSYIWSTGETGANITVSPSATTTYTVTGAITATGCTTTATATVYVETPLILTLVKPESVNLGEEITLTVYAEGPAHSYYNWFVNNAQFMTTAENYITFKPEAGRQQFRVETTTTDLGCFAASESSIVNVEESVMNAINPYNPSGRNCCFMKSDGTNPGYRVEIYNRYMQKIFEGDDGWDGTYRGSIADPGTYFYRLHKKNGDIEKGTLEVIKF